MHLSIERIINHLVATEPLSGVHPGDLESVLGARELVDVLGYVVAAHLVGALSLHYHQ